VKSASNFAVAAVADLSVSFARDRKRSGRGMDLRIELLGGFRLTVAGEPRPLPIRKAQLLLARTALAPRMTVGRSVLGAMLWETSDEAQARTSLRQALAHVRRALGPAAPALRSESDRIALDPGAVSVDVAELEAAAISDGADPAPPGGELLEGLESREPAVEEWLAAERRRVRELQIAVCGRIAERALAARDFTGALAAAARGIAADPLRESLHRAAMRALAASGDKAAALQQFRDCRDVLERELGARPEPATLRLYEEIRAARAAAPAPRPLEAAEPAIEIRQATILCAAPAAGDDPEAFEGGLRRLRAIAAAAAERHGGTPVGADGAEVVLAFGLRDAREDDAARAKAAAAEILAAAPDARLGCAAGRVVFAPGPPPSVAGETRGRAAALMATARPGALELGAELRDTARPEPVFVGRTMELGQLRHLLAQLGQGQGAAAVVTGEPGIGKTRLTSAFAAEIEAAGGACIRATFEAFGRKTRALDVLAAGAARLGGAPPPGASAALRAIAARMLGLTMTTSDTALLAAMTPDRHEALRQEMTRALLQSVPARPLLILIEDAHWAEAADVEALTALTDDLGGLGAMLLATERTAEAQLLPALRRRVTATPVIAVALGPFTAADGTRLADAMGVTDPRRVAEALERTRGNPLFLARLLAAGPGDGRVPTSIVALVQEQTDRLGDALRSVLRQAAVLGQSFLPDDYAHIFGAAAFGDLVAAGFLARDRDRLAFVHALVHEAIYASVPRADRRRMHAAAAAIYRRSDAERWADHALAADAPDAAAACAAAADVLLPRHDFAAGARYIEAGLAAARSAVDRAPLLISRGSLRREVGELDGALADYGAVSAAEAPAELRAQALVRQAWVHRLRGALDSGDAALAEARALDPAALPEDIRAEIENQLGAQALARGDRLGGRRHSERALALARSPLQQSRALGGLGEALYAAGRMMSAGRALADCIALARANGLGVVEVGHIVLEVECLTFADPGPAALEMVGTAVEITREAGNGRAELMALHALAEMLIEARELDRAAAVVAEAGTLLHRLGATGHADRQIRHEAMLRAETGDRAGAERALAAVIDRPGAPAASADLFAERATLTDDAGVLRRSLEDGEVRLAAAGVGRAHLWFRRAAAEALLAAGDWAGAAAQAEALERFMANEPSTWSDLVVRRARLLAKAGAGAADEADRAAARTLAADLEAALLRRLIPKLRDALGV
jgi:DNA-binding SARP family transcriptional activator